MAPGCPARVQMGSSSRNFIELALVAIKIGMRTDSVALARVVTNILDMSNKSHNRVLLTV